MIHLKYETVLQDRDLYEKSALDGGLRWRESGGVETFENRWGDWGQSDISIALCREALQQEFPHSIRLARTGRQLANGAALWDTDPEIIHPPMWAICGAGCMHACGVAHVLRRPLPERLDCRQPDSVGFVSMIRESLLGSPGQGVLPRILISQMGLDEQWSMALVMRLGESLDGVQTSRSGPDTPATPPATVFTTTYIAGFLHFSQFVARG